MARGIWRELGAGRRVFLDARPIGARFPERFPTVFSYAQQEGLDPRFDLLPVSPAAHYYMGGVLTDDRGRTSLPGLWAAGEVASTGVHGANRLASNSLLEGMVFGARLAADLGASSIDPGSNLAVPHGALTVQPLVPQVDKLREAMWEGAGLVRDDGGLRNLLSLIDDLTPQLSTSIEGRNLALVGRLVASAALARTESRGGHYRSDFPAPDHRMAHRTIVRSTPRMERLGRYGAAA